MAGPGNQSTLLSTLTEPEFTDLVRRNWVSTQEFISRNAKQMFIMDRVGSSAGSSKLYNEYDTETYGDVKQEGAAAAKAKVGVGYNVTMTSKTVAKQVDITLEERVQNRYQEVLAKITSLAEFCENRIDLDLTHRLTFATAVSYTDMNGNVVPTVTGDALALASASHALAFSATTYSNLISGNPAFSQTSLQSGLLLAASNIYNNFGQRRQMNFNAIFCWSDPATEQAIDQLINSTADVDAVQAGIVNTYRSKFQRVSLPNLATTATGAYDSTKRRWWGIAAIQQGFMGWQGVFGEWMAPILRTPSAGNNGENIDTLNWTYTTACMYGIATVSPRGIIFGTPTS
jgi:hypothetical protein